MARHDPTSSSDSETSEDRSNRRRRDRHRSDRRSKGDSGGDKDGKSRREKKKKSRRDERKEERRRERRRQERRRNRRRSSSESDSSSSGNNENLPRLERVVGDILEKFPNTVNELIQLLQMIDEGQAVDTRGISDKYLLKYLKKLFLLLRLNENGHGVFLLPSAARPILERIGPLICLPTTNSNHQNSPNGPKSIALNVDDNGGTDAPHEKLVVEPNALENPSTSGRRRIIGPEMPSSELLAAAAKLTEAESELRDAELDVENDLFIGPPPPALVAESASANEAERFEEVSRIMGAETDSPYDVLGVNHNTSTDNIKKRTARPGEDFWLTISSLCKEMVFGCTSVRCPVCNLPPVKDYSMQPPAQELVARDLHDVA